MILRCRHYFPGALVSVPSFRCLLGSVVFAEEPVRRYLSLVVAFDTTGIRVRHEQDAEFLPPTRAADRKMAGKDLYSFPWWQVKRLERFDHRIVVPGIIFADGTLLPRNANDVGAATSHPEQPDELVVFHQALVRIAADVPEEIRGNAQALVPIGQREPLGPEVCGLLDGFQPWREVVVAVSVRRSSGNRGKHGRLPFQSHRGTVNGKGKGAEGRPHFVLVSACGSVVSSPQSSMDGPVPAPRGKTRVGVQKGDDPPPSVLCTVIETGPPAPAAGVVQDPERGTLLVAWCSWIQ
mmetsp:Transcript_15047/g.30954  ORF Transcript_15047/g.30954 Transcript_15047/m.30954 type:complete len:294 (+) Transcript_15047:2362-3243(+)